MWGKDGYTGPVAHWWESNFLFTGALYDWRYEGIIDGYRILFGKTGEKHYLDKALRAADMVVLAQRPDGRYRNSSFQFGPVAGGTPHEAAIDTALFLLAGDLEAIDPLRARRYRQAAQQNIGEYWLRDLWNGRGFSDQPDNPVLVANKHGTVLEALVAGNLLDGDWSLYVNACVEVILGAQVLRGVGAGGTIHGGIGPSHLAVPIYTARALNGLLTLYDANPDPRLKEAILSSLPFFKKTMGRVGVVWGVYGNGRVAASPEMIAGAGDVLRLLWRVEQHDWDKSVAELRQTLFTHMVAQQYPTGGIPTGLGFARKGRGGPPHGGDIRDILPVVGWVDKAFRAFALLAERGGAHNSVPLSHYSASALWKGRPVQWEETAETMEIRQGRRILYRWTKGEPAPTIYAL